MKLNTLIQAAAYKLIRSLNCPPESRRSKILLDRTRSALEAFGMLERSLARRITLAWDFKDEQRGVVAVQNKMRTHTPQ